MPVVREEDDLCLSGKLRQGFKACGRALIIEVNEQIIGDKRQCPSVIQLQLQGGEPQRQVKLIACALAHSFDLDQLTVRAATFQTWRLLLEVGDQALEGASRENR